MNREYFLCSGKDAAELQQCLGGVLGAIQGQLADHGFNFAGGLLGTLGQRPHLLRDHGEHAPGFSGPSAFDSGVEVCSTIAACSRSSTTACTASCSAIFKLGGGTSERPARLRP